MTFGFAINKGEFRRSDGAFDLDEIRNRSKKMSPDAFEAMMRDIGRETRAKLQARYDAGEPFYTKAALRRVGEQLEAFRAGGALSKVVVPGIDGVDAEIPVPPNSVTMSTDGIYEKGTHISYRSTEEILGTEYDSDYQLRLAFLPMVISDYGTPERRAEAEWTVDVELRPDSSVEDVTKEVQLELQRDGMKLESVVNCSANGTPFRVEKIIGIACGTMFGSALSYSSRVWQHALLLALKNRFSQSGDDGLKPKCYAQDPNYSDKDKQVLGAMGVTVLEDPRAFLEVDESSIVVCFGPNIPVQQIIADIARPALMIWDARIDDGRKLPANVHAADGETPRVTKMLSDEYTKLDIPSSFWHETFTKYGERAGVYVRNSLGPFPETSKPS